MGWLTDLLKGLGLFVGGVLGGAQKPPKRPPRVDVPDNIWAGSPAGRRRKPPENGHAEYDPDE